MAKYIILALIVVGLAGFFITRQSHPLLNSPVQSVPTSSPQPTSSPTLIPTLKQIIQTSTPIPAGPPQGQISCNYQIPAGPGTYGTAEITATWANLPQASICVSVNGQSPSLMSSSSLLSGTNSVTAPWIVLNGNYSFGLYSGNCAGTVLSSCKINTLQPVYSTPRPTKTP